MGQGSITKDRIFQAALKQFAQHGFEGARMEKIAAEVGINKASLYFHFKSKEEIFQELFQNIITKYQVKMKQIMADTKDLSTKDKLIAIYQNYLEYNLNNPEMEFWNRVYYLPPSSISEEVVKTTVESKKDFISNLTGIMEDGIKNKELRSSNPQHMATTFYYLITCIDLSSDLMSKEEAFNEMEHCFDVLWSGIKGI
ncbi:TetR/AcrR family transcriptional regulator [Mobilitalea sibirica]|uniref:TetR/AcrR family transcriptional regulator n=1 Tax=Mobilitalea sibirica TaxID=1462919 RepID=A0A8J7HAT6_9FIRM|nr:TetR/AcrR family transcriptional regulator [Mobilitalea sibirica]MBH1942166.1 TetR/AcrR family transcriptional regulator [Mobilitalea sibirica]